MWWAPLVAIASGLISAEQRRKAEERARGDLKNSQIEAINLERARDAGADKYQLMRAGNITQDARLERDIRDNRAREENPVGSILQMAGGDSGFGSLLGDLFSKSGSSSPPDLGGTAGLYAGGDFGSSLKATDFSSPSGVNPSLDDGLLKRLDQYGIDYGGRQRLLG